jgi:hypothetical protein
MTKGQVEMGMGMEENDKSERKTNKAVVMRFAVARASRGGTIERM